MDDLEERNPSYKIERIERLETVDVYTDVKCASCEQALKPAFDDIVGEDGNWKYLQTDGGLHIALHGGYGEFLDSIGGETSAILCEKCAQKLLDENPWMLKAIRPSLSMNVGHECLDGEVHWVPMGDCLIDPDKHGWRTVWQVVIEGPRWKFLEAYDTEEEAKAEAAKIPGATTHSTPIANTESWRARNLANWEAIHAGEAANEL